MQQLDLFEEDLIEEHARKLRAFKGHRNGAKRRGIEFEFTFKEWCRWWEEQLGPAWINKRGCRKHSFVMARHMDEGPYVWWNVKCITNSQNAREQTKKKPTTKLTPKKVKFIYQSLKDGTIGRKRLAKMFDVHQCTIRSIKRKVTWSSVTDKLD